MNYVANLIIYDQVLSWKRFCMGLPTISFNMQSLKHESKLFIGAHTSNTTQSTFMEDGKITAYEFLAAGLLVFFYFPTLTQIV